MVALCSQNTTAQPCNLNVQDELYEWNLMSSYDCCCSNTHITRNSMSEVLQSIWHSRHSTQWPCQCFYTQTTILLWCEQSLADWAMSHVFFLPVLLHGRVQIQNKLFNVWFWASFTHQQLGYAQIKWHSWTIKEEYKISSRFILTNLHLFKAWKRVTTFIFSSW